MRRRLLLIYLSLTAVLLLATEIPLGINLAVNGSQRLTVRQIHDTLVLASAAEASEGVPPQDRAWTARADAWSEQDRGVVLLFDADGRQVFSTRPDARIDRADWQDIVHDALAGRDGVPSEHGFDVRARRPFAAEPVLQQGRVAGAVATIGPARSLRSQLAPDSGLLLAVALAAMLASAALGVPLVRWSLRPARQLQTTVRSIAQGQYSVRAPADRGPAELRELAQAVNAMADRLVSVLEAQRSFVADASHQMRNPLTALRLRVETLEGVVPEAGREDLAVAVTEADRLSHILDELLVLANAYGVAAEGSAVEVRSVIEARARAWSDRAEKSDVTIAVQGRRAAVICLPGALDQVLDVLLDNALGFSPPGGRVTVRTRADGSWIHVEVEDEGPGMSAEDKAWATDRFWRGRQQGGRNGSGLGLAIAKALLDACDARLELDDAEPHGLLVRAVLPRVVPAALPGENRGPHLDRPDAGRDAPGHLRTATSKA